MLTVWRRRLGGALICWCVSALRALMRRACGESRSMREQFISFGGWRGDTCVDSSVLSDGQQCQSITETAAIRSRRVWKLFTDVLQQLHQTWTTCSCRSPMTGIETGCGSAGSISRRRWTPVMERRRAAVRSLDAHLWIIPAFGSESGWVWTSDRTGARVLF